MNASNQESRVSVHIHARIMALSQAMQFFSSRGIDIRPRSEYRASNGLERDGYNRPGDLAKEMTLTLTQVRGGKKILVMATKQ